MEKRKQAEPAGGGLRCQARECSVHSGTEVCESGHMSPSVEKVTLEQVQGWLSQGPGGSALGGRHVGVGPRRAAHQRQERAVGARADVV